ncbi:MAG: hypothetical protein HY741_12820 [Chloroflexi bacterium]|nr:hypothetical protein [Chloroflexota bacterium]
MGVRFGLLGVKNVGAGPIQAILDGRGEKPFESLDDFCTRVDLKQVNRRVLESLIKAGAFDAFGARAQLLEAIDRMLSVSASHHSASAAGQMSLFGGAVAVDTFGDLPLADPVDHKTQLEWEKELMGVYFSPHPLLKLAEAGKKHVGAFVGEITHDSDGHQVTIGGIIKSVRQIITKKGDAMAFLQVEDPQGAIEVVAFPRTFNDCRDVIHEDALVLVRGKVQVREDKIAILADLIWNYPLETPKPEAVQKADRPIPGIFSNTPVIVPPLDTSSRTNRKVGILRDAVSAPSVNDFVERIQDDWMPPAGDWDDQAASTEDDAPEAQTADDARASTEAGVAPQVETNPSMSAETQTHAEELERVKPSDDDFSDEPVAENTATKTLASETATSDSPITDPLISDALITDAPITDASPATPPLVLQSQPFVEKTPAPPPDAPPKPVIPEIKLGGGVTIPSKNGGSTRLSHGAPAPRGNSAPANAVRESATMYVPRTGSNVKVRVRLQRTHDHALDTKHMREVVKLLRSAEGRDRFALVVPLQSSWVELDFPNFYTNFQTVQQELLNMVSDWGEVEIG